jgi:hypothetical protein
MLRPVTSREDVTVEVDRTNVTETFDMSTSRFPPGLRLLGYPGRHRDNVARSVANVVDLVATRSKRSEQG